MKVVAYYGYRFFYTFLTIYTIYCIIFQYIYFYYGGIILAKKKGYGNESIKSLKGAERVRMRPAVIFGSDGLDGCSHSVFEIVSNSAV